MDPHQIALILVDIQKDFWPPFKEHERFSGFPGNVSTLLELARSRGLPVVHVRSSFKPDRSDWMLFYKPQGRGDVPAIAGTEGASIEGFAAPLPGEHVVVKQTFDAFVGTDLEEYLSSRGVSSADRAPGGLRCVRRRTAEARGHPPDVRGAVLQGGHH